METENYASYQPHPEPPVLAPLAKIGSLVLLKPTRKDSRRRQYWQCQCYVCGKEKEIRADNLTGGRVKTCTCQRQGKTVGRRNHKSSVLSVAGIPPRFEIYGYMSPKRVVAKVTVSECYGVLFVVDPTHKGYCDGDRSKYYMIALGNSHFQGGRSPQFMRRVMRALEGLGWVNGKDTLTLTEWIKTEGVIYTEKQMRTVEDTRAQYMQMMRAAHIDFRGQVIG